MYRGLLSRMLVMALLVAVIAKPCTKFLVGQVEAAGTSVSVSSGSAGGGERISRCFGKCLSARIEEAVVVHAKALVAGGDEHVATTVRADFARFDLSHQIETDYSPRIVILDVRRRLTFLSRFLL